MRFPSDLFETWRRSLAAPAGFFRAVSLGSGIPRPILYFLIVTVAGAFFSLVWSAVYDSLLPGFGALDRLFASERAERAAVLLRFSLSPFAGLVRLFVAVVVVHAFASLLGTRRVELAATARVLCYASGPAVFRIVPFLGGVVAAVATLALAVVGIREAHDMTTGSAVAAICLSILVPAAVVGAALGALALGLLAGAG